MDPLDATVTVSGWFCPICAVEVGKENTYCQVCLYARPMDRQGVPQIFAGYKMHFNGVIPRTLKHPSHAVEWRMAERHGAVCLVHFDLIQVNLLVYRTGYERSDKVRKCVEGDTNIPAVPITWMLDCLLQSRQIHTALYRLTSIPAVAQPAGKGTALPHHQHPYYLMNVQEYAIPTSFPPEKKKKGVASDKGAMTVGADANLPPFFEVQELQYANIDVFKAVCNTLESKHLGDDDNDQFGDERETRERRANIELLKCEQRHNRVDKLLFSGMKFFLTPSLESDQELTKALKSCGGTIVNSSDGRLQQLLRTSVTHVLYDHGGKKGDVMIEAAQVKKEVPGLTLAQINWAEDCLMLGEVIPPYGQYVPTQKLLETLSKKYERR